MAASTDFDFMFGDWTVRHRRLTERLAGSADWQTFDGTSTTRGVLGGSGNIEDNVIELPGGPYRAVALRSFDKESREWAIWWLDGRDPWSLDVPVTGSFTGGEGRFFADTTIDGQPIRIRFTWDATDVARPRWSQAFSADEGETWETNWQMEFFPVERADAAR